MLDSAQDAIVSIDQHGTVSLFNRAAERMFGYDAREVIGHNLIMLMPAPYRDEHAAYVARYERTGIAHAIGRIRDVHGCRKNGEIFPIELSVSEGRYGEERIYTAILRDVSERVHTQAELHGLQHVARQRERLADIGAITAQAVDDLGNPLAALSCRSTVDPPTLERGRRERAVADGRAGAQLDPPARRDHAGLQQLRARATARADGRVDQRSAAAAARPLVSARRQSLDRLVLELPEQEMVLHADGQKMWRVIENLLKNAIEAIDQGPGRVTIQAARPFRPHSHLSCGYRAGNSSQC